MDRRLQGEREREMEWSRMGFLEHVETILSRIEQIELTVVLARLPMCRFVTTTASVVTSFCSLASPPPAPAPSADANLKRRANRDDDEMYKSPVRVFFFFAVGESLHEDKSILSAVVAHETLTTGKFLAAVTTMMID